MSGERVVQHCECIRTERATEGKPAQIAQESVASSSRCRLLRDYQRLLETSGGETTPEIQRVRTELEEILCEHESALERANASLRQSENQLRQAQKMEAIALIAGGVAHDFNNILTVILGATDLLLAEREATDPARDDLETIRAAGVRGATLTHRLLLFSRRQVTLPKVIEPGAILKDMEKMLRRVLGEDVALVCQVESPAPRVKVDPVLLEQVLMNLSVNARDAMPDGGQLEITVSSTHFAANAGSELPPGNYATLTITDNGVGMDAETRARAFEPFFTTKDPGRGTGLGLSTVSGIVEQCGGRIALWSEPGKGTRFVIYLPSVNGRRDSERPGLVPGMQRGTETILVVEDEDSVRAVTCSLLRQYGYKVLEARNGGEALLTCEKHRNRIDLLLADVVMPHMSGPELAARLSLVRRDMKVLLMSGYPTEASAAVGVYPRLQKPLTASALTQKVREVLDKPESMSCSAPSAA